MKDNINYATVLENRENLKKLNCKYPMYNMWNYKNWYTISR